LTKNIGDNYKIYSLIIIIIARFLTSGRCGLFNMSKSSHLTMISPYITFKHGGHFTNDWKHLKHFVLILQMAIILPIMSILALRSHTLYLALISLWKV
jgi:hypothetical protein